MLRGADSAVRNLSWPGIALAGATAALALQTIHLLAYRPIIPAEVAIYLSAGLSAGLMGAAWARRALASHEAFDRATRKISEAGKPEDVAAAFSLLATPSKLASVTLWKALPAQRSGVKTSSPRFQLWASWPPAHKAGRGDGGDAVSWPRGRWLAEEDVPGLGDLAVAGPTVVLPHELGEDHCAHWARSGIRAAYLVPILRSGGDLRSLAVMAFRAPPPAQASFPAPTATSQPTPPPRSRTCSPG